MNNFYYEAHMGMVEKVLFSAVLFRCVFLRGGMKNGEGV